MKQGKAIQEQNSIIRGNLGQRSENYESKKEILIKKMLNNGKGHRNRVYTSQAESILARFKKTKTDASISKSGD